jgi:hypothetical protein
MNHFGTVLKLLIGDAAAAAVTDGQVVMQKDTKDDSRSHNIHTTFGHVTQLTGTHVDALAP